MLFLHSEKSFQVLAHWWFASIPFGDSGKCGGTVAGSG